MKIKKITNVSTYDNYKDSGVKWIGDIPKSWKLKRLKDLITNVQSGTTPKSSDKTNEINKIKNWYTPSDLKNNNLTNSKRKISQYSIDSNQVRIIPKNSILMSTVGEIGKIAYTKTIATSNQQITSIFPNKHTYYKYLYYILMNNKNYITMFANNTTLPQLNNENLKNIDNIILPSIKEQKAISIFLDKKTSLIDEKLSILEERKKIILELEKSVINQVVTKGLQSFDLDMNGEKIDFNNDKGLSKKEFDTYMNKCGYKDSGIEWIGYIKKDWNITKVKKLFILSRGRVIAKTELKDEGKYPVYSSQTKKNGVMGYIDTYDYKNQKLITWTTDGVNAGKIFKREGDFNCTNVCGTLIKKDNRLNYQYYTYLLDYLTEFYKRPDINGAKIMNNEMEVIPLLELLEKEQTQIVKFLDKKTSDFKLKVSNIDEEIKLLKEYRKTLINDVVTGKIRCI